MLLDEPVYKFHAVLPTAAAGRFGSVDIIPLSLPSLFFCSVFVFSVKGEGFIVAHQVVVVVWDGKEVWVYK